MGGYFVQDNVYLKWYRLWIELERCYNVRTVRRTKYVFLKTKKQGRTPPPEVTWPRLEHDSRRQAGNSLLCSKSQRLCLGLHELQKQTHQKQSWGKRQDAFAFHKQHLRKKFKLLPWKMLPLSVGANSALDEKQQAKEVSPVGVTVPGVIAGMLLGETPISSWRSPGAVRARWHRLLWPGWLQQVNTVMAIKWTQSPCSTCWSKGMHCASALTKPPKRWSF